MKTGYPESDDIISICMKHIKQSHPPGLP